MKKEQRFEKIYQRHQEQVMRLVLGYVRGNREQARDLVQDIFIRVWDKLDSFRGDSGISTWIYRIAVNTCLMFMRSKKSLRVQEQELPFSDSLADGETGIESPEKEQMFNTMYRCIDRLDEENRSIILMELQDISQEEIAEVMGMNHNAVRTRIHRIKDKLSKCVNNE